MSTYRLLLLLSLLIPTTADTLSQVPIDLSRATEFKVFRSIPLGGQISRIAYTEQFCGAADLNVITSGVTGRGRVTWRTTPQLDTTNLFDWLGINAPTRLAAIDYDGFEPAEYVNSQGVIWRCSQGASPFPLIPIDTVANAVCSASPTFSGDVDGDGALDVITEIGRNGVTTRIILGGAVAGKGCERVLIVPVVNTADKKNLTRAFYKSATGEWRLIQEERDNVDRAPRLQMYRVNFTRSTSKPEVSFTALGVFRGEDVSQEDEPFGELAVIVDSVNGVDHMLMDHRIGPPGSLWALERFVITSGEIVSSGQIVDGYNFYEGTHWDLQYSLGTIKPIVLISSDKGGLFSYVDDLARPIALFDPTDTGAQPVIGLAVVNDQTGDQQPDMVFVGGDGVLLVVSLDTAMTSIGVDPTTNDDPRLSLSGSSLTVVSNSNEDVTIEIASVDGRIVTRVMTYSIVAGKNYIDLERTLGSLSTGAYFIRVKSGQLIRVLAIVR